VYFAPNGGATEAVIRGLNAAKTQVLMQAYSFTSAPIAKALVEAHKHGVKVLAVLGDFRKRMSLFRMLVPG
jgi:phosphatidylserine/phosphatidylglycerophosphate/cardiolipin synthase-like enzyme